ncbi:hypothetical protein VCUG_00083 [Vavraia culicis subsp. floridensis]|uniref:Uncharacterized protein n=1 Tax=Vavraia culicis (isolate floridensis) TaxID=948595 RepID=L2GXX3_VAVCU|nr:uncharacterized protein VCUG_00083 [Vavraia culicis subsp. floridensis]ELA48474.1 hypothetical protein VCUG_00083 [Vavraia culicis subsp. floridensis]
MLAINQAPNLWQGFERICTQICYKLYYRACSCQYMVCNTVEFHHKDCSLIKCLPHEIQMHVQHTPLYQFRLTLLYHARSQDQSKDIMNEFAPFKVFNGLNHSFTQIIAKYST